MYLRGWGCYSMAQGLLGGSYFKYQNIIKNQGIKNTRYDGAQILESQHGKYENSTVT